MAGDGNYGGNGSVYGETILADGQVTTVHDEEASTAGKHFRVNISYCVSPIGAEEAAPANALTGLELAQAKSDRAIHIQSILDEVAKQANDVKAQLNAAVNNPDRGPLVVTLRLRVPMVTRRGKPNGTPNDPWEVSVHWD